MIGTNNLSLLIKLFNYELLKPCPKNISSVPLGLLPDYVDKESLLNALGCLFLPI